MTPLNETIFEEHIAEYLSASDLYNQRTSRDFSIEDLCDKQMLEQFLKAQPAVWEMLTTAFPGRETEEVVKVYNGAINRGDSILWLLHKGLKIKGKKVKLVQFKPVLDGPETDTYKLYRKNTFSVVRQMKYSVDKDDKLNELDLCILINGIPLLTCELKNEGTGQTYRNGIYQYRYERNFENRMLRNCLVHFVMDNNFVFMTTKLEGEDTNFLPFNRDSVNPPIEGEYPTAYMWQSIFQADSLLDIVENFIKRYNEDGKTVVIFPRYHQLRAVRLMRKLVREEGPGHNYLVQHSAGSGKTKSMAWLAHQLANMTNEDKTPVFDSIIMVTDRIVLNRNQADDVLNFQTTPGVVKDIRRGSKNLAAALNEGHNRIIISTIQKFAFALKNLKRETQHKYAVIIDEAHTAIGNESAKDLVHALSTDEDLKAMPGFNPDEYEDQVDALMAYMQVMRRQMAHISYFAFTATPKDKTFAMFGTKARKAHDLYSMKQAIDEKFILDVLKNYKSFKTMFELIEKNEEDDKDKLFKEKKALRVIYDSLNKNQYIMLRKATIMVDHFMQHTINKIGKQAKAMVVCDSRRAAADYKSLIDRIIQDRYDGKIKTLVAFSGEVEDSHGLRCTEASMNDDHVTDNDIADKFKEDDYKILIVAEKFQTGFDQPLLHTMYVDRTLGGIQCIQTLSRLNRRCVGKEDTMIIDFRNDIEKVRKAFQEYYAETTLEGEVDTQRIYSIKSDIDRWNLVNDDEVDWVVRSLQDTKTATAIPSMLKQIIIDRIDPLSESDKDIFRKLVNRYIRQYGFIAQFMDFTDPELEKFYIFCKVFFKYLPFTKETLPMEVLDRIDLEKLRIQMSFEGQLKLEDEESIMKSSRIGEPGKKTPDEEKSIKEILDVVNSPFASFLDENDKILKQIWDAILVDPEVTEAFAADNSFDMLMKLVEDKFGEEVAKQIDKYVNFAEVLEREKSLSVTLMRKFVEALAIRSKRNNSRPYDEEQLKEAILDVMGAEFDDIVGPTEEFDDYVSTLFYVLNTTSIPSLDGINDTLKTSLNNIYCNEDITLTDKRIYFQMLVSKYEAYLKKVYYLCYDEEVKHHLREGENPNNGATLSDAIYAFKCLRELKYDKDIDPISKRLFEYLSSIKDWRNTESHMAQEPTEEEVKYGLNVLMSMYLFVSGKSYDKLKSNGME